MYNNFADNAELGKAHYYYKCVEIAGSFARLEKD